MRVPCAECPGTAEKPWASVPIPQGHREHGRPPIPGYTRTPRGRCRTLRGRARCPSLMHTPPPRNDGGTPHSRPLLLPLPSSRAPSVRLCVSGLGHSESTLELPPAPLDAQGPVNAVSVRKLHDDGHGMHPAPESLSHSLGGPHGLGAQPPRLSARQRSDPEIGARTQWGGEGGAAFPR